MIKVNGLSTTGVVLVLLVNLALYAWFIYLIVKIAQFVGALRGVGVLTVTDTGGETADAGIINFVVKDNRVRFGVDDEAATENGLVISSRLLTLAIYVRPKK